MLNRHSILIVEDDLVIAACLADEVEALKGRVVGPAPSVAKALALLATEKVTAAVLDGTLTDRDVTPVGLLLAQLNLPFVVHSAIGIPEELERAIPTARLVLKPSAPYTVIANLLAVMADTPDGLSRQ